ncbi:sulfatase [Rhizobium binxianense]
MRLIFVLFDTLNRHMLQPYGGDIETPNFQRLADRTVTFDRHYVGSMPCIPARRDIMTGRVSFFHRSWGPMEPWELSFCAGLREKGIHSHLITDHYHYFREGGSHYHTRFDSWDLVRGQESDPWKAIVDKPLDRWAERYDPRHYGGPKARMRMRHQSNREFIKGEEDYNTPRCFASAFEFLDTNRAADNWMLQLEMFDPHEPFFAPDRFRREDDSTWTGRILDWPYYSRDIYTEAEAREIRANYRALVRMCDEYLGRLLDYMDRHDMWKDTALMVGTDHGFMLGEQEWWGKNIMPYYDEMMHTPLFLHHPELPNLAGTRCSALTQTPDMMPTIIEIFGCKPQPEVTATSLLETIRSPAPERIVAFGYFAGPVGVTDGRYVMMHYPPDVTAGGIYEYTLMPQHLNTPFSIEELKTARLSAPFDFTRGVPVMRIDALPGAERTSGPFHDIGFRLYDMENDPGQRNPIRDDEVEARLYKGLRAYMRRHDTPSEYYDWLGLEPCADSRSPSG